MPLSYQFHPASSPFPAKLLLVFLHGFLGSSEDWDKVLVNFNDYPRLAIDLPGHGESKNFEVHDFSEVNEALTETIQQVLSRVHLDDYVLFGYSLGGRVAMFHACSGKKPKGLKGLVVEGGHPGLQNSEERDARFENDRKWASRFEKENIVDVLNDWYRQPVFASLTPAQREAMIQLRADNDGKTLSKMLLATSLSVQPDLTERVQDLEHHIEFMYVTGSKDKKFSTLAENLNLPRGRIVGAGHNAHSESPDLFAEGVDFLLYCVRSKHHD